MPESRGDDLELIAEFQAGSESAARELFDKYCERLMRLARKRIGQRMTSRVDPEDVIQSVFRTFFTRAKNDEFSFHEQDDLLKLLIRLTVHKVLRQIAHHRAAKRNPELEALQSSNPQEFLQQISAENPTPDMEVALLDEFEQFIAKMQPLEREVLQLKLQGYSTVEIAEKLGSYDRKVRRIIERVQELARERPEIR